MSSLEAIDVHAHYGAYRGQEDALSNRMRSGAPQVVLARARAAGIGVTCVSPLRALLPRIHNDAIAGNEDCARVVEVHESLRQWVVIDPRKPPTFAQAAEMQQSPRCVGIKIHPVEHGYSISEEGRTIFEFAARQGAVIITHSGETNCLPAEFVPLANDFPEVTLILAHLGWGGADGVYDRQVRAIQACKHGNVFVDTSSAKGIMPGLLEWAVGEIGAERVLFGTDSPLYFAPMQRARVERAELPEAWRRMILSENARRVLRL